MLVAIATLAGTELLLRGYYAAVGRPFSSREVRRRWQEALEAAEGWRKQWERDDAVAPASGPEVLHPYLGFGRVQQFQDCYDAIRNGKPDDYFVVMLGGSVAAGQVYDDAARQSFEQIVQTAAPWCGRRVRLLSLANGGYKQPQQVMVLGYFRSLGVEPDAVVDLDGFNEVALAHANVAAGLHVSFPSVSHWATLVNDQPRLDRDEIRTLAQLLESYETVRDLVHFAERFGLHRSAVLATWWSWRIGAQTWVQSEAYARFLESRIDGLRPEVCGPAFARQSADAPFAAIVELWRHSSEALHDLCRGAGIPYLHVLQPTLLDAGAKPLTTAESGIAAQAMESYGTSVHTGYPLLRHAGEELRRRGVPFHDASGLFHEREQEVYYDACHLNAEGKVLLAEAVARAFVAAVGSAPLPQGHHRPGANGSR